jgi:hypothetical protein
LFTAAPLHLAALFLVLLLAGCATESVEMVAYEGPPPGQKYTMDEVLGRAEELEPGMSKLDVMMTLGSPAETRGDVWVYLPNEPGIVLPEWALEVEFERGRYVEHSRQPVVVGERLEVGG